MRTAIIIVAVIAAGAAGYFLLGNDAAGPRQAALTVGTGEELFNANCADCHGPKATGSDKGPPLVHIYYEPSHHGDESFQRAVALGAQAHHWKFGDMAAIEGLSRENVEKIILYVRGLQREAGIE